ncbi:MAG: hypothetical protein HFE99_00695 [Ruminiclostridium sp.]|jgi:hypothetical protein|nr:hypothetical protein [Ruminiclostridium sp.]
MDDIISKIDELIENACYLIDIFPYTIPETLDRRYFKVEEYFQKNRVEWNRKFCNLLLKLYCYYDFWISAEEKLVKNPEPELLAEWIWHCFEGDWREWDDINIILPSCNAMVILNGDDLYMTLYNPDKRLIDIISQLAGAEGLFVYKATETQK